MRHLHTTPIHQSLTLPAVKHHEKEKVIMKNVDMTTRRQNIFLSYVDPNKKKEALT
jgi:hypothetical protein